VGFYFKGQHATPTEYIIIYIAICSILSTRLRFLARAELPQFLKGGGGGGGLGFF